MDLSYGFHSVESLIESDGKQILEVIIVQNRLDQRGKKLIEMLENSQIRYRIGDKEEADEYAGAAVHQGVIALIKRQPQANETDLHNHLDSLQHSPLILVLDQIQDPHNLGACIRTADGAGVDAIVVPKNGACPVNQTVRKVAAGAANRIRIFYVTNLARTLDELREKGVWVTGATDQADQSLYQSDFKGSVAIAMGSEGKGLRRLTLEKCDQLASIPMHGSVSSLNVSVATGVFLFEATRQRALE
ncbi:MAG: 23S rRNA (guanosine(2251)-2'-O)-methyltransferase RlmB [Gammaproteobacteria bacterium]|nr:23S rRNA (guanosine(2251)-2'-O)-methyltransferase RlmB [Gammaproteobacteria bacterium]